MATRLETFADRLIADMDEALEPTSGASSLARKAIEHATWQLVSVLGHEVGYPFKTADWLGEQVANFNDPTRLFDGT